MSLRFEFQDKLLLLNNLTLAKDKSAPQSPLNVFGLRNGP